MVGDVIATFSRNALRILAAIAARPIPHAPACHAGCLRLRRQPSRQASVVTLWACHGSCYFLPFGRAASAPVPTLMRCAAGLASMVSANVVGRRRSISTVPPPRFECRFLRPTVPRSAHGVPSDACPLRGSAERTRLSPRPFPALRAVAPFYESGDALHAARLTLHYRHSEIVTPSTSPRPPASRCEFRHHPSPYVSRLSPEPAAAC